METSGLIIVNPVVELPPEEDELPLAATSQFAAVDQSLMWLEYPLPRAQDQAHGLRVATPGASTPTAGQMPSSPAAHEMPNPQSPNDAAPYVSDSLNRSSIQLASKLAWSHRLAELALSDAVPQQVIAAAAAAALAGSPHGPVNAHYDLTVGPTITGTPGQQQSPSTFVSTQLPHLYAGQPGANIWASEESLTQSPSHTNTTRLDAFAPPQELASTSTTTTITHRPARQKAHSGAGGAHSETERLQAQVQSLDAANQELRKKVGDLAAQLELAAQQQQKQADTEQSLKAAVAEADTRLRGKEHQLQVSEHQVDALSTELAAVRAALAKEQAARQEALDEVANWKGEQQHMARTLEDTTRKMNVIGGEERRLQAELQQLRREYGSCTDALAKAKVELSELRERLQEAQQEAQRHSVLAHRAEMGNDGLSSQVVMLRNRLTELESRNGALHEEVRSLRQEAARKLQQEGAQALRSMQQQALVTRPAGRTTSDDMSHPPSRRGPVAPPPTSLAVMGSGRLGGPPPPAAALLYTSADDSLKARYDQDVLALDSWQPSKVDIPGPAAHLSIARRAMAFLDEAPPSSPHHYSQPHNPWSTSTSHPTDPGAEPQTRHSLHSKTSPPGAPPAGATTSASGIAAAGSKFMSSRPPSGQVHLLSEYARPSGSLAYSGNVDSAYLGSGAFEAVGQDNYHRPPTYLTSQYSREIGEGGMAEQRGYAVGGDGMGSGSGEGGWGRQFADHKLLPSDSHVYQQGLSSSPSFSGRQQVASGGEAAHGLDFGSSRLQGYPETGSRPESAQQSSQHVTGLDVPFGTERTLKDILKRSQAMEDALVNLCHEKSQLDAEYAKLPLHGGRNSKVRNRKAEVEARLDTVQKEISTLRLTLKKLHGK